MSVAVGLNLVSLPGALAMPFAPTTPSPARMPVLQGELLPGSDAGSYSQHPPRQHPQPAERQFPSTHRAHDLHRAAVSYQANSGVPGSASRLDVYA